MKVRNDGKDKSKQTNRPDRAKSSTRGSKRHHVRPLRGGQQYEAGHMAKAIPTTGRLTGYWSTGDQLNVITGIPQH